MSRGAIIVTGASRGIGAATAKAAAAQGYKVCVNYKAQREMAKAVVSDIQRAGGTAIAVAADVADPAALAALFTEVDRALGPLAGLVNNAGIPGPRTPLLDLDAATMKNILDVNVLGSILCAQEAARRMAKSKGGRGGVIVNISSTAARTGGFRLAAYVAAKGAIVSLTRALAAELAEEGIRVNAVAPGVIATDQHNPDDPALVARIAQSIPMRRAGTPEEVAQSIMYLMSDAASYVTGAVLDVAGGK